MSAFDLERFVLAQDQDRTYARALAELQHGRKVSHWMWFVFPQIAGLGQSATSRHFAISSRAEAEAYLAHPVLGQRLTEAAETVAGTTGRSAAEIFGGLDAQKLRSCMTLFSRVAPGSVFDLVLERFFEGQPDPATDELLAR